MPLGSLGRASRARRTYGGAGDILMTPELEASLVSRVGDRAVGGIAQFANVLDLPGSVVRDFFTGNNPVDQLAPWNWTSSNNRASGRDVLRTFGLEPTRQHGFAAAAADIGTSMVLDPLSYITLGGSALTRGGRVASAAGLMDDATRVAASKLGRPAGMVGRREARLATTLDDLLKANPLKRQAAETAASGMGLKLDDLLGDQLGGMVGIGLPFASPTWVAGTGARGMRAAKSMDAVQDAIQYARIPGTNFQPVNSFARLFNAKLGEAATPIGQAASETLFNRRTKGQYQARGVVAQMMTELEDLGMAEEQYSDVLRAAFELPGAIDNVPESLRPMVDRARSMLRYMPDEAADWGVRIKEYLDPEAAYFPRFVSEGLHPKHNKAGRVFSSFDPSQGERMTFMHGIRGGTVTSKDVWRDEVLNQLIDNKAGVDAVADQLRTLYAGRATDTYIHPQASKDLIREVISSLQGNQQLKAQLKAAIKNTTAERAIALAKQYLPYAKDAIEKIEKKHTKDRFKEMATWFSGLSKETRDTAVFGNSPLADLQARLLNYSDSIEAAKVFTETLAQPGLLQSAASEGGMTVDELIRKSGLQIGTPDKGPIAKLAEMMGISRAGLTDDQWKAELMKLRQSKVSSDIAEDMIRMQKGFSTPDSVNPIIEAVQNITNFTKSNLTSPFPAFHVRNILSGQFNNWIRGMFSKRSVYDADTMARAGIVKDAKEYPIVQQIWAARNQASSTTSPSIGNPLFAMNTRGQGVQYHGARGPIGDFSEGFYSPDNIYGGHNTFYSTDAVDVAVGYGRKQPTAKVYQIEETGPVNFFDMEQAMEGDQLRALFPDSDIVDDAIGSVLQDKGAPANLREVMDEIRAMSKEYGISKDEVQEIFDGVTYNLGQKGFGGMSHVGGLKTGADKHTVKIYFDPKNQIRLKDTGFNPAGGDELVNLAHPAYHGSPHKFAPEKLVQMPNGERQYLPMNAPVPEGATEIGKFPMGRFSTAKIGTGEGAQAYGWGLYFAGNREVGEWYREKLTSSTSRHAGPKVRYSGSSVPVDMQGPINNRLGNKLASWDGSAEGFESVKQQVLARSAQQGEKYVKSMQEIIDRLAKLGYRPQTTQSGRSVKLTPPQKFQSPSQLSEVINLQQDYVLIATDYHNEKKIFDAISETHFSDWTSGDKPGGLYSVDLKIPENSYLDWDKTVAEQTPEVRTALDQLRKELDATGFLSDYLKPKTGLPGMRERAWEGLTGKGITQAITYVARRGGMPLIDNDVAKTASMKLRDHGVRGNKFLDGNSRSRGQGHYNYVVFDDDDVEILQRFTPRFKPESPATKLGDTTAIGKIGNKEINKWSQHEMQTIASHDGFSRISQDHARFSTMIEGLRKQGALRDEDASILRLVFAQSDVVSAMPTDMHAGKVAIDALGNPDYQAAGLASLLRQGGKFKTRVSFVDDELRNRGTNLMLHELAHIAWYRGVHQGDAIAAKAIEEFDEILRTKGDKAFFDFFAATKGPDRASYYTSKPAEVFAEYFAHSVIRRRIPQGAIGQYMTAALDWLRDMLVKMRLSKALDSKTRARLDELIDQVGGFSDSQAMQSRAAAMTMPPSSGAGAGVPNVPGMPGSTPSVPPGAGAAVPPTAPPAMPPQGPPLPPNMPGSTPQAPKPPRELDDREATRILAELAYAHQIIGKYQGEAGNVLGQPAQLAGSTIQDMLSQAPSPTREGFQMTDAFKTYFGLTPDTTWNPLAVRGVGGQAESRFAPLAGGEKFGWYSETINRLGPFLKLLREGVDPAEAAKRIGDSQVNYANRFYTRFERDRVSLLLPFYKFSRGMMPATLRELAEKPGGKLAQTMRAINSARDTDALTPDYVAETASIPLNGLPVVGNAPAGTQRYLTGLGLMFEDPLSFFGGGVRGAGLEFLSRTNPLLKAPLEWATGESFFQRGPRGGRELEDLDPTIGRALSNIGQIASDPGSILAGGNPAKVDPVTWPGSQAMEFILGNSPAARLLSSARAATDPRKSLATKALNLLTGVRISDVSPEASEAILRERTRDVMQMLGSRTFERTYFPQERMDGLPPELQLEVLQLQALMNTLAARAKARAEAAANR